MLVEGSLHPEAEEASQRPSSRRREVTPGKQQGPSPATSMLLPRFLLSRGPNLLSGHDPPHTPGTLWHPWLVTHKLTYTKTHVLSRVS